MAVETVCDVEASATSTDSSGSAPVSSLASTDSGCDGSCTDNFLFFVQSVSAQSASAQSASAQSASAQSASEQSAVVNCLISASTGAAGQPLTAQTFTLPSDVVSVFCNSTASSSPPVPLVSGTLTIESIDTTSLRATFALELSQPDGSPLDISNGKVSISGCHQAEVCTF